VLSSPRVDGLGEGNRRVTPEAALVESGADTVGPDSFGSTGIDRCSFTPDVRARFTQIRSNQVLKVSPFELLDALENRDPRVLGDVLRRSPHSPRSSAPLSPASSGSAAPIR